jgi:hypothetical protein
MDENTSNANEASDNALSGDLNSGPSSLDTPAPNLDADAEAAEEFYALFSDNVIKLNPDSVVLVLMGTYDMSSVVFNLKSGRADITPCRRQDHYSDFMLERVMPLWQEDGSINIGFTPKVEGSVNVPGSVIYGFENANKQVVANAVAVIRIVPGLKDLIWAPITSDLLQALPTMEIQHNESYVADATISTNPQEQILELVVPLHSGYAENQNRYATVEPVGLLMEDDPNTTGDNSLRYWVRPDAKSVGAIEEPFMVGACGNVPEFVPTVVVIRPKLFIKPKLHRIAWERLMPKLA